MENESQNNQLVIQRQASLLLASVGWEPGQDNPRERLDWFSAFASLPKAIKHGFLSEKSSAQILDLASRYQIQDPQRIGEISRLVREAFTKNITAQETESRIKQNLQIPADKIKDFSQEIRELVILVKEVGKKEMDSIAEKISVIDALKKNPDVAALEISNAPITDVNGQMLKPTVKSWLDDYVQRAGAQSHSNLERSDYLYNSENAQSLSDEERQKILPILESYDNNTPLYIDKEDGSIVFDAIKSAAPIKNTVQFATKAANGLPSQSGGLHPGPGQVIMEEKQVSPLQNSQATPGVSKPFSAVAPSIAPDKIDAVGLGIGEPNTNQRVDAPKVSPAPVPPASTPTTAQVSAPTPSSGPQIIQPPTTPPPTPKVPPPPRAGKPVAPKTTKPNLPPVESVNKQDKKAGQGKFAKPLNPLPKPKESQTAAKKTNVVDLKNL